LRRPARSNIGPMGLRGCAAEQESGGTGEQVVPLPQKVDTKGTLYRFALGCRAWQRCSVASNWIFLESEQQFFAKI